MIARLQYASLPRCPQSLGLNWKWGLLTDVERKATVLLVEADLVRVVATGNGISHLRLSGYGQAVAEEWRRGDTAPLYRKLTTAEQAIRSQQLGPAEGDVSRDEIDPLLVDHSFP